MSDEPELTYIGHWLRTNLFHKFGLVDSLINCLNPALITGKAKDGDRWIERVDGKQIQYYYVQSVKAVAESAGHEPKQAILQL